MDFTSEHLKARILALEYRLESAEKYANMWSTLFFEMAAAIGRYTKPRLYFGDIDLRMLHKYSLPEVLMEEWRKKEGYEKEANNTRKSGDGE